MDGHRGRLLRRWRVRLINSGLWGYRLRSTSHKLFIGPGIEECAITDACCPYIVTLILSTESQHKEQGGVEHD